MRKHIHPQRKLPPEPRKKTKLEMEMQSKVTWRKVIQGHLESPKGRNVLKALLSKKHASVSVSEMARDQSFIFNLAEIAHEHEKANSGNLQPTVFTMNMLFDNRGTHHTEFTRHFSEAAGRLLSHNIPTTPRQPTVEQLMRQRRGSKWH